MHLNNVLPERGQFRMKTVGSFTLSLRKGMIGGLTGDSVPDTMRLAKCLAKVRGVDATSSSSG
jgi:hypothetical protein